MKLYDLIKKYGTGKGESTMWESVKYMSEIVEKMKETNEAEYWKIVKGMYATMVGKHFNEEFAMWQVEQMYFKDKNGGVHKAPYWSEEKIKNIYETHKGKIPSVYNCWDFYVAINMLKADNYCMLMEWQPNSTDEEIDAKIVQMAINYFNDEDAPHPHTKIWSYFHE